VHVYRFVQFMLIDPSDGAMLGIQNDLRTAGQQDLVGKRNIMRSEFWVGKSVGRVEVLKYANKSCFLKANLAAQFAMENPGKGRRDSFVLQDDTTRYEVEAFGGFISSQPNKNLFVRVA
jgi:hypothetical protein